MNIHEYQAKTILRQYGVAVPRGDVAYTPAEARAIAQKLGGRVVVKAQIHAGGRGKGGGVKLAKSIEEVRQHASQILGMQLKTPQTGPQGQKVRRLLVEEGANIAKELYVGLVVDRGTQRVALMASAEGGMDIEEVAAKFPQKIDVHAAFGGSHDHRTPRFAVDRDADAVESPERQRQGNARDRGEDCTRPRRRQKCGPPHRTQ